MIALQKLVDSAEGWLATDTIPDYPQALNGLQLENSGKVTKIVAAVDACLATIEAACDMEADLLVVHHGLFWQGAQKIEGSLYKKLKRAIDSDLAIYSSHIPLDVHLEFGNNAQFLAAIGFKGLSMPFFPWKGINLGLRANVEITRDDLIARVESATGERPHVCPGGPKEIRKVGVITGGAGSEIFDIAETGIDTFITGEGPHWSYTAAEELGINVIYAGHYATETFGVKALAARWCRENPGLSSEFFDHPTGL
ncbi:MAG: Nif3-like dinuclear metal center hexameric protein [Verrucomicrobiales bacterium]|nr:Nif3-like dinuclear metal center hexameric protein [Verrucomicrobiales bacterium]